MLLVDRVLASVRKHGMLPAGGRVLVALSGGADSVGLLHIMRALADRGELSIAGVAHLHHGLRPAAAQDEQFCRELAATLAIPYRVEHVDVRALARQCRTSLEDAGRRARYAFFERAAVELAAQTVATGHTLDDQAETFLLQMIRGAGPRGLSSINPSTGRVCRPLLEVGRAEVRTWLTTRALPFRDDESNQDLAFTRNRVRHRLLPLLRQEFSPGIVEVLGREAAIARDDESYLQAQAIEVARTVVLRNGSWIEIDAAALRSLHPAVASRIVQRVLAGGAPDRSAGHGHVQAVLGLATRTDGAALSLPGQEARRTGNRIVLRRRFPAAFAAPFQVPLPVPGEVGLEAQGWAVSAASEPPGATLSEEVARDGLTAVLQSEVVAGPLSVRSRRKGDTIHPAGMQGRRKKLQDLFVDRKVARDLRDSVPLVVDRDDRILWVVGHAVAEDFRVTEPLRGVLLLKARRLGGLG